MRTYSDRTHPICSLLRWLLLPFALLALAGCGAEQSPSDSKTGAITVTSYSPPLNAPSVSIDTVITAFLSDPIDDSQQDLLFTLTSAMGDVAGTTVIVDKTLTFTPDNSLDFATTYTASISANNNSTIELTPVDWTFNTSPESPELDTVVTLTADRYITASNDELVTFGLPLKEGQVTDTSEINISQAGKELAAYVEEGLKYHWSDNSIRSVTIQLDGIDMSAGDVEIRITNGGANIARTSQRPHSAGWTNAGSDKSNLPYPRIFALHDKSYLAESGLIAPYAPAPTINDAFQNYQDAQFEKWAGSLDYSTSSRANWLFDRSSAMFKAYMSTGKVEFLKEAFLSKQFYFTYVRDDGVAPAPAGGDGCWTYGGGSCADGKYIYSQPAKLAWGLLGDKSQWDEELINNMALQADLGWYQYGTRDEFSAENEGFTERGAGISGLAEINAYEITADETVLNHLLQRIESLKDMQQTEKPWDIANGWTPKSGAWSHNIGVHEGIFSEASAPTGDDESRGFSPWMSENIVDFLWQSYWVTGNSDVPDMLRQMANAVDLYGFISSYDADTGIHVVKPEFAALAATRTQSCNRAKEATALLYFGSKFADSDKRTSGDWWRWYSDNHNIQTVLTLASGYYFEADPSNRIRLQTRIEKIIDAWAHEGCSTISSTPRLWNWQHRSNSIRTWNWIVNY